MAKRALYIFCALVLAVAACSGPERPRPEPVPPPEPDRLYVGRDEPDVRTARSVVQKVLETQPRNQGLRWRSDNGATVTVTPLRTFKIKTGHYCRDYREVVSVGTVETSDLRRACRRTGGTWVRVPMDAAQSQ